MTNLEENIENLTFALVVGFVYTPLQLLTLLFSKKIKDEKQLEKMLNEESFKLGIKNKKILARFGGTLIESGACRKLLNGSYEIVLDEKGRTKAVLRHELYHIYRGDLESNGSFFKRFLVEEPRAILYQSLDIKL